MGSVYRSPPLQSVFHTSENTHSTSIKGHLPKEGIAEAQHLAKTGIRPSYTDSDSSTKSIKKHETTLTSTANLITSIKKSLNKISFSPSQQKVSKTKAIALIVSGIALAALGIIAGLSGVGAPVAIGLCLGGLFLIGAGFHMKDEINTTNKAIETHNQDIVTFPNKFPILSKMKFHSKVEFPLQEKLVDLTKDYVRLQHAKNFLQHVENQEKQGIDMSNQILKYSDSICDFLDLPLIRDISEAENNIKAFILTLENSVIVELDNIETASERLEKGENELRTLFFDEIEHEIHYNPELHITDKGKKQEILDLLISCRDDPSMDTESSFEKIINEILKQIKDEEQRTHMSGHENWQNRLKVEIEFIFADYCDALSEIDRNKYKV